MTPQEVAARRARSTSRCAGGRATTPRCARFVNIIATPKGGTHLAGFEPALLKTFRKQVEANARRLKISAKDTRADREGRRPRRAHRGGHRPAGRAAVRGPDQGGARDRAPSARSSPASSRPSSARCSPRPSGRTRRRPRCCWRRSSARCAPRISARKHKEISRRKNALETSSLPAKLADCRSDDVERSELFIVEGDTALGTAKLARSSDFQALLPIRGKILNVQKASVGGHAHATPSARRSSR